MEYQGRSPLDAHPPLLRCFSPPFERERERGDRTGESEGNGRGGGLGRDSLDTRP